MIFADKLIQLRKKNGLSQEELADKVGVSRQAVSKWESAQSIPDIDKVIALSGLFGVSIDYLLKDEIEIEDSVPLEEEKKKVSISKANECITKRQKAAQQIALGVAVCVCSPIVLILLAGLSDSGYVKESLAALFGIIFLFVLIAIAVTIFVYSGLQISEYEVLKKEDFNVIKEEFPEELSESLIVSYYNYQSLLDLAEKKKNKIAEEINKWKKEDYSDDLSSLNNSSSKEGRISIASKSYITNGSKKKVNIPIITISSAEVPETTKIEAPK